MTPEEFRNIQWQKPAEGPERERRATADSHKFWRLAVPLGLLFGLVGCIIGQSGGYFLPVSGISILVVWGIMESE